ncbi:hypothetical protein GALMADRAFT_227357 [Galerina marginata CBS 339.88]|uniref:MACPF-like domain-containing protein n=1 Tax=Galerina marginata (strain CBS 339.88) TaxID=685588 RepID=A0A067STQ3_GALM3|nr:hypothetical protein GALMADRAFT_227357 [Galerina marginata CBS 339.88]
MAPDGKTPQELLQTVPFNLVFRAEDGTDVKTDTILSQNLPNKDTTELSDLRVKGNLSSKFRFCFPSDSNTIAESTQLGIYILSTPKNVTALQNAGAAQTVASLVLSYRSNAAPRPEQQSSSLQTEPADMSEHDWNVVMLNNSLLHGMVYDPESKSLQPAREPAFRLKTSHPDPYASPAGCVAPLNWDASDPQHVFLAPAFEIADDSSITFTSVRNSVQESMTQNSFSSWSVEASASGGYGGFSGGVDAKGGQSSSDLKQAAREETMDKVHASYNFPRVKVFLDGDDLEVSDVCKKFWETEGRGYDGIDRFYKKFGTIFTRTTLLGARLHSTVETSTCIKVTKETKKEEKTASVSASFSSPFASASASSTYTDSYEVGTMSSKNDRSGRMHWEARGGANFLAVEPTAWINTVGVYQNWRVIERHDVCNIFNVGPRFKLFDGMSGIKNYLAPKKRVYLIASDGRLLQRSSGSDISLIDPYLTQGGSARWNITVQDLQLDTEVTITDMDKVKNLYYNGTSVIAQESPFTWKVWQAAPGSDIFFISCLSSDKTQWLAIGTDKDHPQSNNVVMTKLDVANDNQVWRLLEV